MAGWETMEGGLTGNILKEYILALDLLLTLLSFLATMK